MFINEDLIGSSFGIHHLRKLHKALSIPETPNAEALALLGVYNFQPSDPPEAPADQHAVEGLPMLVDGVVIQQWVFADDSEEEKKQKQDKKDKKDKVKGVKFENVFCAADDEDAWNLKVLEDWILAGNDINFQFSNGNTLLLTAANHAAFLAVWMPFRASFYV